MAFDTSKVGASIQQRMLGTTPNATTPEDWIALFAYLQSLTDELVVADEQRRKNLAFGTFGTLGPSIIPCEADALCMDLQRWRARLDWYSLAAASAPPGSREAVLWEVTAPMLLGFHGGPTGVEVMLAPGGYAPGFDSTRPHGADVSTPFVLANANGVAAAWEQERHELLAADIINNARELVPDAPLGIPWWAWLLGGGFALKYLLTPSAAKVVVAGGV